MDPFLFAYVTGGVIFATIMLYGMGVSGAAESHENRQHALFSVGLMSLFWPVTVVLVMLAKNYLDKHGSGP